MHSSFDHVDGAWHRTLQCPTPTTLLIYVAHTSIRVGFDRAAMSKRVKYSIITGKPRVSVNAHTAVFTSEKNIQNVQNLTILANLQENSRSGRKWSNVLRSLFVLLTDTLPMPLWRSPWWPGVHGAWSDWSSYRAPWLESRITDATRIHLRPHTCSRWFRWLLSDGTPLRNNTTIRIFWALLRCRFRQYWQSDTDSAMCDKDEWIHFR